MSLFWCPTWLHWRQLIILFLDTDDLKPKIKYTQHNTPTMVILLCGSVVSRRFLYCFIYWIWSLLHCFQSWLYCCVFCHVAQGLVQAFFKMATDKVFFCLHAIKSYQPCQYGRRVFVWCTNMATVTSFENARSRYRWLVTKDIRYATQYQDKDHSFVRFHWIKKVSLLFLLSNSTDFVLFWGLAPLSCPLKGFLMEWRPI